jgi:uncharacterized membrane protein YgaE (UPF0421/DUF939 family)
MAAALPSLSPLWRNSLRTWLAATLTIGIMLWSGRSSVMMLGLLVMVVFINDTELTPLSNIGQLAGGALIGILTAVVLHQFSSGWLVTAIGLLITGCLVRGLGLMQGVSMGYLSCWALEVVGYGKHFNGALVFDLAFTVVVGIAMAQVATWVFWPRRPLQQLPALERGLCQRLSEQIEAMEQWLEQGGPPPTALHSQTLLPQILQLQQLRDQRQNTPTPQHLRHLSSRWAQTGSLWRQLLRQWLLLEPLLLELSPPLEAASLLRQSLSHQHLQLQPQAAASPQAEQPSAHDWLQDARHFNISPPLILALAQQLEQLQMLLHSRGLVMQRIQALGSCSG